MKEIIYIEIPVEIEFSIEEGYTQTWDEPGQPTSVEDISFDRHQVIEEINDYIFGKNSTIDEDLLAIAEQRKGEPE